VARVSLEWLLLSMEVKPLGRPLRKGGESLGDGLPETCGFLSGSGFERSMFRLGASDVFLRVGFIVQPLIGARAYQYFKWAQFNNSNDLLVREAGLDQSEFRIAGTRHTVPCLFLWAVSSKHLKEFWFFATVSDSRVPMMRFWICPV
jgi:hypothetical protein